MAEKETGRLEAFSDGVFAVAITLLVLDIHVPSLAVAAGGDPGAALLSALKSQWPSMAAYVISFLTILVMWINHNRLFEQIHRKDHQLLVYNGLLLMLVTLIPFPTALVAEYIRTPYAQTAAAVYCGLNVLMACAFNQLWSYAAKDGRLLAAEHDPHRVRHITQQYRFGPILYGAAFALAFVNVTVCVIMVAALAVFFALPERTKMA
ncbi:DUF1211 domain-containing membrane protein [Capsulimonas corticalis]|uniref:DUF1211 domain-containing membrane protein n=1 Tax=Capsulimonas corticalis TaxID=2219043 RepID=A0A402D068_9BACT|nr:TMEM175 family protein [Capsulimonas corticalis]BDI33710.1 DUF1211 domain-containing membrane protein [Capsulimonas corticalis]